MKDIGKCFKLIQGLLVIAVYIYEHQEFMNIFLPDKVDERPYVEGKKKKNKKKG